MFNEPDLTQLNLVWWKSTAWQTEQEVWLSEIDSNLCIIISQVSILWCLTYFKVFNDPNLGRNDINPAVT